LAFSPDGQTVFVRDLNSNDSSTLLKHRIQLFDVPLPKAIEAIVIWPALPALLVGLIAWSLTKRGMAKHGNPKSG